MQRDKKKNVKIVACFLLVSAPLLFSELDQVQVKKKTSANHKTMTKIDGGCWLEVFLLRLISEDDLILSGLINY